MSILGTECSACVGYGYLRCSSCMCTTCAGSGRVTCTTCTHGEQTRKVCSCTTRIVRSERVLVVFSRSVIEPCWECSDGKVHCSQCHGSAEIDCPGCRGERFLGDCSMCSATRKVECAACDGRGRLPSPWVLGLSSFDDTKLMFEHQRHSAARECLEIKLARLAGTHDRIQTAYDTRSERARIAGELFNHQMHIDDLNASYAAIDECQSEMAELGEVLSLLDTELGRRSTSKYGA